MSYFGVIARGENRRPKDILPPDARYCTFFRSNTIKLKDFSDIPQTLRPNNFEILS